MILSLILAQKFKLYFKYITFKFNFALKLTHLQKPSVRRIFGRTLKSAFLIGLASNLSGTKEGKRDFFKNRD